jgi:5S rRNA maturation endonuclease (ribonuclease M5)
MSEARRRRRGSKEERRLEEVEHILSSIRQLGDESCILVEGRRDRAALRALGVEGRIVCLQQGRGSISERVGRVDAKNVIILMDFDPEGHHLAKLMYRALTTRGRAVDLSTWRRLKSYLGREVRDVEGLASYISRRSR